MEKVTRAGWELRAMEELAAQDSPIHRLNPLAKLIVTVLYILAVVSFPKYALTGLIPMVLYPIVMFQLSGIPVSTCFYKLRLILPLVCAVGIANPFLDRGIALRLGGLAVSGGVLSMLTLMLKGVFALMASFLLVATTRIDALCASLRRLHVPGLLVTLFLLTYRYVGVMVDEVAAMSEAYALRAPGQRGVHVSAWGSFLGQLLLRSMDRASELYGSMQLRGFHDHFHYVEMPPFGPNSALYMLAAGAFIALARWVNIAGLLGGLFVR